MVIVHDTSEKSCRKCRSSKHLDYACYIQRCASCNELGHSPDSCENSPVCPLCKSLNHLASQCQFNWARPKLVSRAVVGHEEKNEDGLSEESGLNVENDSDGENEWENKDEDEDEDEGEGKGLCKAMHAGDSDDYNRVDGRLSSDLLSKNMDTDMCDAPIFWASSLF